MIQSAPEPITKEKLLELGTKEELAEMAVAALEAVTLTTKNMVEMQKLHKTFQDRIKELEDKVASQEAEIIALRNRP